MNIPLIILMIIINSILLYSQQKTTIQYSPTNAIFRNPERGFSADTYSPITQSFINNVKSQNISVIHRIYTIPQFRDTELSVSFLTTVENDLINARNGGVKLVMRFSYTDNINGEDAALDTILIHINQLKPILESHYDVIAYLEAGFIGAWGEWYYSTHNLNNTNDRRTVLFALLDALPQERCVVVRTPDYKRKIFNDSNPISLTEAFNGSKKSRTGAHNDCFLASATDYGTYLDDDIEGDKNYLNLDNRFVPQGGETCSPSEYSGCANALTDLNRMHWSILNKDYHPDVLQGWINSGCMDEIKRKLGYRFSLLDATIVDSVKPGGEFLIDFNIYNIGFASPYNPRGLEIILRNKATKAKYKLVTDVDPRLWFSGDTVNVSISGGVKSTMPEGEYEVFLFLPDTVKSLHDRADYAIRLANNNVWEDSTGYNSFLHSLIISKNAYGNNYNGSNYFELFAGTEELPDSGSGIIIDGNFDDWRDSYKLDLPPLDENSGDALNPNVDITDVWVTSAGNELFFSYKMDGDILQQYFYHVFIDVDNDTSTGFHSGGSYGGFDFMIENTSLWKYTGTAGEWQWNYIGETVYALGESDNSRMELSVSYAQLDITDNRTIGVVFNVNDNDDNSNDDYAPDNYTEMSYEYSLTLTSIQKNGYENKNNFKIKVYPNPFNGFVNLIIPNLNEEITTASIYNINGKKIKVFNKGELKNNRLVWNGKDAQNKEVGSGVYFFKLSTKSQNYIQKLIMLK